MSRDHAAAPSPARLLRGPQTAGALSLFLQTRPAGASGHNEHCSLPVSGPMLVLARLGGRDKPGFLGLKHQDRQMGQLRLLGGGGGDEDELPLTPHPPQGQGKTGLETTEVSRIWPLICFSSLTAHSSGVAKFTGSTSNFPHSPLSGKPLFMPQSPTRPHPFCGILLTPLPPASFYPCFLATY